MPSNEERLGDVEKRLADSAHVFEMSKDEMARLQIHLQNCDHLGSIKDTQIQALTKTNEALVRQIQSRWSPIQALTGLLALVFTINFGYQLFKSEKAQELVNAAEIANHKSDDVLASNKQLVEDSSKVIATFSRVLSLVTTGYYEAARQQDRRAKSNADQALALILDGKRGLTALSPLHKSYETLLMPCWSLSARCCFLLKETNELKSLADQMVELMPDDWLGYHYRGLYWMSTDPGNSQAIEDFRKSMQLNPHYNIDHFNFIEVLFANSKMKEAAESARKYLSYYPEHLNELQAIPPKLTTSLAAIADMYNRIARLMERESGAKEQLAEYVGLFREGQLGLKILSFDTSAIQTYLQQIDYQEPFKKLAPEEQQLVKDGLNALIDAARR
jgi:tetratricopeptide (TPR) repeat protein